MKRHKLTRSTCIETREGDHVEWPKGTTVWTTGETDINGTIEAVPYPSSEFKVWFQSSDLRPTENL